MSRSGIVNVRMVITEEKILSNIDKIHKMINPKSKKQIIQLEEDTYFKDLIESIKTYLIEYPKKKNFPPAVYKAAYDLVEFATNLFEENTKQIEELIRQREANIASAGVLKDALEIQRVILPDKNGFKKYKIILDFVLNNFTKDNIILIALGPTATVLAYEFCKNGYQALDIGHMDVEYEWYLLKAKRKIDLQYKSVNEVSGVKEKEILDKNLEKLYLKQIRKKIL